MANSDPQSQPEWVTVSEDEVDELKFTFDLIGEALTGEFLGTRTLNNPDGPYTQYRYESSDGQVWFVNGNYSLQQGMQNVRIGSLCRITYVADKDTGQATPMRIFSVEVARRKPSRPQAESTNS